MSRHLTITEMYKDMVANGYITLDQNSCNIEDLRMPGELPYIPTIATYSTLDVPAIVGTDPYAKLEQRT